MTATIDQLYRQHTCIVGIGTHDCPSCGVTRNGPTCSICGHSDEAGVELPPLIPPIDTQKSIDSVYEQTKGKTDDSICESCFVLKEPINGGLQCPICGPAVVEDAKPRRTIVPPLATPPLEPDPTCPNCRRRAIEGDDNTPAIIPTRDLCGDTFVCGTCGHQQTYADAVRGVNGEATRVAQPREIEFANETPPQPKAAVAPSSQPNSEPTEALPAAVTTAEPAAVTEHPPQPLLHDRGKKKRR